MERTMTVRLGLAFVVALGIAGLFLPFVMINCDWFPIIGWPFC